MKAAFLLVPLLGFTWIIGLFAVGEEGRVFAYLFVIANVFQVRRTALINFYSIQSLDGKQDDVGNISSVRFQSFFSAIILQGLFIFLFHVLRHEKVYGKIKDKLPKLRKQVRICYIHAVDPVKDGH